MSKETFTRTTPKPLAAISDWEWSDQEFKDFIKFMEGKRFSTYDNWSKSWYSDTYKVENGLAYQVERTYWYCSTITSIQEYDANETDNKPRPITLKYKNHEYFPSIDGKIIRDLYLYIDNLRQNT
jgi:hypothetical protein